MKTLPAAAIPKGALISVETFTGQPVEAVIEKVHNSTPKVGRITWDTDKGQLEVGGAQGVEVLSLP